jgi:hypothetical protein
MHDQVAPYLPALSTAGLRRSLEALSRLCAEVNRAHAEAAAELARRESVADPQGRDGGSEELPRVSVMSVVHVDGAARVRRDFSSRVGRAYRREVDVAEAIDVVEMLGSLAFQSLQGIGSSPGIDAVLRLTVCRQRNGADIGFEVIGKVVRGERSRLPRLARGPWSAHVPPRTVPMIAIEAIRGLLLLPVPAFASHGSDEPRALCVRQPLRPGSAASRGTIATSSALMQIAERLGVSTRTQANYAREFAEAAIREILFHLRAPREIRSAPVSRFAPHL